MMSWKVRELSVS